MLTVLLTALATGALVLLALNFTAGEKKVQQQLPRLYSTASAWGHTVGAAGCGFASRPRAGSASRPPAPSNAARRVKRGRAVG